MMGRAGEGHLIALAGNPNVGKSTLFNALTGQRQHTGNWPGKTVSLAQGAFSYKAEEYALVDLPGTYSLQGCSREEEIATEFLAREDLCCTLAVCDATNLERSLLLALEVMERTERVMLCVNLMDEAAAAGVTVDLRRLEAELGVPVIGIAAARKQGLDAMQERLRAVCDGFERPHPRRLGLTEARTPREAERNVRRLVERAEEIAERCVETGTVQARTQRLDRVLTGKITGPLLMVMLLFGVLWLTISGANPISGWLEGCFGALQAWVRGIWRDAGWLEWLGGLLLDGVFGTTAKVVAVMLPPVAIFFPLFSILEEVGYLPRIAYLLDEQMARTGGCGRQVLTMCMGCGCNAVGVTGCRIIGSERERMLAVVTNGFMPCNGRFPLLIALGTFLFAGRGGSFESAVCLMGCLLLSVWMTLAANAALSWTVLRGAPSAFVMELPPYRRPRLLMVLVRSLTERVGSVLGRAAMVAAPAGAVIWGLANIQIGGSTLLTWMAGALEPVGCFFGMNGAMLLAFLLGWPANELVFPLLVMIGQGGSAFGAEGEMAAWLAANGWDYRMALCAMVFCLFHWPCSTTVLTIRKETGSRKWTLCAVLLPTAIGLLLCRLIAVL